MHDFDNGACVISPRKQLEFFAVIRVFTCYIAGCNITAAEKINNVQRFIVRISVIVTFDG